MLAIAHGKGYSVRIHQSVPALPYVVLMHGFMGASASFEALLPYLTKRCNPITIDLLGHGDSDRCTAPDRYGLELQARDIGSVLSRLQITPLYLYGYSMGGRIALETVLQNLQSATNTIFFSGLMLESTGAGIRSETERKARLAEDRKRADHICSSFTDFLHQWIAMPIFGLKEPQNTKKMQNAESRQALIRRFLQNDTASLAASIVGASPGNNPSRWELLQQIDLPVLLLGGSLDIKYVDILGKMKDLLPRSTLRILSGAAHRVHQQQPKQTAAAMISFIDSVERR